MINQLNEIRDDSIILKSRIRRLTEQMHELEWSLIPGGMRYDKDNVQTSPEDRMCNVLAEMSELQLRINKLQIALSNNAMRVRPIVRHLTPKQTRVGMLFYGYAYTVRQIARAEHMKDKSVKQTLYRLKKHLM